MSTDDDIATKINQLVAEEHRLRSGDGGEDRSSRLAALEESLDQCWDLLRQRRAKEEYGQDPDAAEARPVPEVESYQQ